jgi:crotonobetaine/carnitine-CoA ligase
MSMVTVGGAIWQFSTFSRSKFWSQIEQSHATIVIALANVLTLLWGDPPSNRDRERSLRTILSAAVPKQLHRSFEERFAVRIMEQYGMTEMELLTVPNIRDREVPLGSCGRVGSDFELAIFDENDNRVPFGTPGKIVARPKASGLMMLGYDDDAVPTVDTWQNLWFHTEDIGYMDEQGFLFFVDRARHVIRRRSENISSWELENILLRHPDIAECAVVGIPSALGEQDVKASICLKPTRTTGPAEVYEFCRRNMARFMVPRYIEILSELPHNHVGKIEKTQLLNVGDDVWDADKAAGNA